MPVFISYSSKDRRIAETICQALESRGQRCWIACRDVKAGENFQEAIVKALRQAPVMLLVFSSNANNSEEIKKELVLAGRHRVTVIPVRVEDVVPNDAFAYEFATRQWVDLFQDWEREIEYLSLQIKQILETAPPEKIAEATVLPLSQKKSGPLLGIAAVMALLLLVGAALAYWKPWRTEAPSPHGVAAIASAQPAKPLEAPAQTTQAPAIVPPAPVEQAQPAAPMLEHKPAARQQRTASLAPSSPASAAAPSPASAGAPPAAAAPVPVTDTDETAWQAATGANTHAGFAGYIKSFPAGLHAQEAQQRMAMLILNAPATGVAFDGRWQTTWTCPNLGSYLGYSYKFEGQVKDGVYHGLKGEKGQPSSMVLDGKIESDGAAAFSGEVIVGSSMTGLGVARGTASDFQAAAMFAGSGGEGHRLEGRPCSLSFARQ